MFAHKRQIFFFLWLFLGILPPAASFTLSPEAMRLVGQRVQGSPMTLSEVLAMPPPCQAIGMGEINGVFWAEGMKQNGTIAILDRPENAMAKDAVWFHHYCWGLLEKYRAFSATSAMARSSLIRQWRGDMNYIVDWTAKEKINWVYLPVIHTEIAESYMQDKDYSNAIASASKAIEINANYVRAYLLLADIYEEIKDRPKALAAVTEGLKHMPTAKGLQLRYKELGGKMPFPEPYAKSETPPSEPAPAAVDAPADAPAAAAPPAPAESPQGAQTLKDPYCRFCP